MFDPQTSDVNSSLNPLAVGFTPNLDTIADQAIAQAKIDLQAIATSPDLIPKLKTAFGEDFNRIMADSLFQSFANGDFSALSPAQILPADVLQGANGAFAASTDAVYLNADFVTRNAANIDAITGVVLEEYGHAIDSLINAIDPSWDEGEVWSGTLQGKSLDELNAIKLRAEDDSKTIFLNGKFLLIEQATDLDNGANYYVGGAQNDDIYGKGGNDTLFGQNGNDRLNGGGHNDWVWGGPDADSLWGETGVDQLRGDDGNDELNGGDDNDMLWGGGNNDKLWGENGNDRLEGESGNDQLNGGSGNDTLYGSQNEDKLEGQDGNDQLNGDDGNDTLEGQNGNDDLRGGKNADQLRGDDGNDELRGGDDNDMLWGGRNDDKLWGENGNDRLEGESGNDELNGGSGSDTIYGSQNDDKLWGEQGSDQLNGDDGNDTLNGYGSTDFERDTLAGWANADRFVLGDANNTYYTKNGSSDFATILGFNQNEDVIQLKKLSNNVSSSSQAYGYRLFTVGSNTEIRLDSNGDTIGVIQGVMGLNLTSRAFTYEGSVATPSKPDLKKYWFYYNYNAQDYRLADSYQGSVIAPVGKYNVNSTYDININPNETGNNGTYKVYQVEDYNDDLTSEVGRVFVNAYTDRDHGSEKTFVPYNYKYGVQPSGTSFLGSEFDYIEADRSARSYFGGDKYEADPHPIDGFKKLVGYDGGVDRHITFERTNSPGYIDENRPTWLIIHGWDGSSEHFKDLAKAIEEYDGYQVGDQVLTLDWSAARTGSLLPGQAASWIDIVAESTVNVLKDWGISPSTLNLVGHSYGSYVAYEIAERLGGINKLVALSPASNTFNRYDKNQVDFSRYSQWSWAFTHKLNSVTDSGELARTADESFDVDFPGASYYVGHGGSSILWANMLRNKDGATSRYFGLEDMNGTYQTWRNDTKPWRIDSPGKTSNFEATIYARDTNGTASWNVNWVPTGFQPTVPASGGGTPTGNVSISV